jgi:hypothetical protein
MLIGRHATISMLELGRILLRICPQMFPYLKGPCMKSVKLALSSFSANRARKINDRRPFLLGSIVTGNPYFRSMSLTLTVL